MRTGTLARTGERTYRMGDSNSSDLLMLDYTKAKTCLGWKPRLDAKQCAILTSD